MLQWVIDKMKRLISKDKPNKGADFKYRKRITDLENKVSNLEIKLSDGGVIDVDDIKPGRVEKIEESEIPDFLKNKPLFKDSEPESLMVRYCVKARSTIFVKKGSKKTREIHRHETAKFKDSEKGREQAFNWAFEFGVRYVEMIEKLRESDGWKGHWIVNGRYDVGLHEVQNEPGNIKLAREKGPVIKRGGVFNFNPRSYEKKFTNHSTGEVINLGFRPRPKKIRGKKIYEMSRM